MCIQNIRSKLEYMLYRHFVLLAPPKSLSNTLNPVLEWGLAGDKLLGSPTSLFEYLDRLLRGRGSLAGPFLSYVGIKGGATGIRFPVMEDGLHRLGSAEIVKDLQ